MAKSVGIDIGSRACKVAVLSGGPKGATLLRFVEKEYEYGTALALTPSIVLQALRQALAEARAPKDVASLAVPAEQCTLRELAVPFTEDDQIKKVVKFEFEPHLHNLSIDDVVLDYVKTGTARNGTRLLVFAAPKEMLRSRLEQLREVGVDPLHLDVDVAALFNVGHHAGVFLEHPNCLVIDIGARTTKTLLIQGGRLKVARSIRLGAQGTAQRVEQQFQGDADAAKQAMEDAAGVEALASTPADQPSTVEIVTSVRAIEAAVAGAQQEEFLQRVLRETQRTLPILAEEQALTRVFLTGGASQRVHARERIAAHFGVEVEDLPVLKAVAHRFPPSDADKISASAAVAIGTALKVLGIDAGEIDLRRDEFRFSRTFDQVKVAVATGVTLVFFTLFLLGFTKFLERGKAWEERQRLRELVEAELTETVLEEYEATVARARKEPSQSTDPDKWFQRTRARLHTIRGHLKDELGLSTEVPPIRSCLEPWTRVMTSVQQVRDKVDYLLIKDEKYEQDKVDLKVIVGDLTDADTDIAPALSKHKDIFEKVEVKGPTRLKDGRYEVPIEIVVLPKVSDEPPETAKAPEAGVEEEDGK